MNYEMRLGNLPQINQATDLGPMGHPVDLRLTYYQPIIVTNSFYQGLKNTGFLAHSDYDSDSAGLQATANTRLAKGWIPYNSLEQSWDTYFTNYPGGGQVIHFFNGFYQQIDWTYGNLIQDPLSAYFSTLQQMISTGMGGIYDATLDYIFMLAWPDLTGISMIYQYYDKAYPNNPLIYRGWPSLANPIGLKYANFFSYYTLAVVDFCSAMQAYLLNQAAQVQRITQEFDLNALSSYYKTVAKSVSAGYGNFDPATGKYTKTGVSSLDAKLSTSVGPTNLRLSVKDSNGNIKIVGSATPGSQDTNTFISSIFKPRKLGDIPLGFSVAGSTKAFSVVDAISQAFDQSVAPALAQLDWLALQIARLKDNPSSLTDYEKNYILSMSSKTNPDGTPNPSFNLFLAVDVNASTKLGQVVTSQLSKAPITSGLPTSNIVQPALQFKFVDIPKIADVKKSLAPTWQLSIDPSKFNAGPKAGQTNYWPWIIGAAAAGAAVYFSTK